MNFLSIVLFARDNIIHAAKLYKHLKYFVKANSLRTFLEYAYRISDRGEEAGEDVYSGHRQLHYDRIEELRYDKYDLGLLSGCFNR